MRRALTSCIVKHNVNLFAEYLMPYNYAIGVKGGANFIYHSISIDMNKYISRQEKT